MIFKLLEEMDIQLNIKNAKYFYNDVPIPRVNDILSAMLHEDYLMTWANVLGLFQRKKYSDMMNMYSTIGTYAHDNIETYVKTQEFNLLNLAKLSDDVRNSIDNAVNSFILWYNDVCENNIVNVIGMENSLSCPWFGGTYDMLIEINNRKYLVDFKTSNHIGYRYFLQLAAYKYLLELQGINLDGCIILQVDKNNVSFEEYLLDFSNETHKAYIDQCTTTYMSLVYGYYNRMQCESMFKNIFGGKK